jgi:hypothetical protein
MRAPKYSRGRVGNTHGNLVTDPDMPAIFQEAGLQGPPEKAELVREHEV